MIMHGGNSGDINILNTEVGNSVEYGILVSYNRQGSITIMNSTISENGNRGIYLTSGRTRLFVSGSNFLRNRRGALFAHTNNERSLTKHVLDKNVFLDNRESAIEIWTGTYLTEWLFSHNLFLNNSGKFNIVINA